MRQFSPSVGVRILCCVLKMWLSCPSRISLVLVSSRATSLYFFLFELRARIILLYRIVFEKYLWVLSSNHCSANQLTPGLLQGDFLLGGPTRIFLSSVALSPQANYSYRATAVCRRS
jgi:hypothetical protein